MSSGFMDGRNSAMSEVGGVQVEDAQGRRMSDPVRPLDRNFGVGGQLSRHRSFGNLQGGGQRQALHQQRVRGQTGGFLEQQAGQGAYINQVSQTGDFSLSTKLTFVSLQGGLTQPQYPGQAQAGAQYPARGYQAMPAQFQPGYSANNFNSGYGGQQGPQQAGNNQIYNNQQQQQQQQQQGFQPAYNQQHQGYGQQQWYPGGQTYEQNNWSQQQQPQQPQPQQHMGWSTGMTQWSGQQQPNSWSGPRQEGGMYPPQLPPHPQSQPHSKAEAKRSDGAGGKSNVEMQPEAYQRTLEYVQQCQSWSSNSVMSPDTTGAKHKRSPSHNTTQDGAVMPPPPPASLAPAAPGAPGAPGANLQDNSSNNMVIGDMTSSMNLLNEENRFLHLMQ